MRAGSSGWSSVLGIPRRQRCALVVSLGAGVCLAGSAGVMAQELEWAAVFDNGVLGGAVQLPRIAVDVGGRVYTASYFSGTVDFDPGDGVANLTAAGSQDAVVVALDRNGNLRWAVSMGGGGAETRPAELALDSAGNLIVGGRFNGVVDFDPGPGTAMLDAGNGGSFLVKLDHDGDLVWAVQLPGTTGVSDLAITPTDDVVSVGSLQIGQGGDFDPGPATVAHTAATAEVYISKLDASAMFLSVGFLRQVFDEPSTAHRASISIDSGGTVRLAVRAFTTLDVDPGPGTVEVASSSPEGYTAIVKLSPAMALEWAGVLDGSAWSWPLDVIGDSLGATYVAGVFAGTVDFDPGPGVAARFATGGGFVVKLDSSGHFERVDQLGGPPHAEVLSVSVDALDRLHLSGSFESTVDFDPGPGTFELTALGIDDAFVATLESDGTLMSAQQIGGAQVSGFGGSVSATVGRTAFGGRFFGIGTVDLDPGPGTVPATATNPGDAFLLQLVIPEIFADGFESGDAGSWSAAVP